MALTKCVECGHDVSTTAAACPHCGAPIKGATPPPLPNVPPPLPRPKQKGFPALMIGAVCLIALFLLVALIRSGSSGSATPPPSRLQVAITSAVQEDLSQNKQELFNKIHFLGDAKRDVIDAVSMQWKDGRATDNNADLAGFTVAHTLYWQTLLTSEGYTKFNETYDCSTGAPQLTQRTIVATNGLTKEGATKAAIDYGAKELTREITGLLNSTPAPGSSP